MAAMGQPSWLDGGGGGGQQAFDVGGLRLGHMPDRFDYYMNDHNRQPGSG
jgi:hypothetical protein